MNQSKQGPKIGLFGLYGWGNLGDAAHQHAAIEQIRRRRPDAQLYAICPNPPDAEERFQIPAYPISRVPGPPWPGQHIWWIHLIWKIIARIPMELILWGRTIYHAKGLDLLIFSSGGQLDDYNGGPWRQPYDVFKWTLLAKLWGAKVAFVSVGAGPVDAWLSKVLFWLSLWLADFRSYRDQYSLDYITQMGFKRNDPIYPDLAFSLNVDQYLCDRSLDAQKPRVVGVGPMAYYDPRGWPKQDETIYRTYVAKLAALTTWLIERGHKVVFFTADVWVDRQTIEDVQALLIENQVPMAPGQVIAEPIYGVPDLLRELAKTDMTIATRFHGILLSLLIHKPALAISYHNKDDSLMAAMDQADFCVWIDDFAVDDVIARFKKLEAQLACSRATIQSRIQPYCHALDEQYDRLLCLL